jgi:hypothetical protein
MKEHLPPLFVLCLSYPLFLYLLNDLLKHKGKLHLKDWPGMVFSTFGLAASLWYFITL